MTNKTYIAKDITIKADLTDYYTKAEVDAAIANEVSGLSNRVGSLETAVGDNGSIDTRISESLAEAKGYTDAETTRATGVESGLNDRLGTIEGDYLTSSDKTSLETSIGNKLDTTTFNTYKSSDDARYNSLNDKLTTFLGTNNDTLSGIKDLIAAAEESEEINALTTALGNKADVSALTTHTGNSDIHVTAEDKTAWNNKVDQSQLDNYTTKTWVEENTINKKSNTLVIGPTATQLVLSGDNPGASLTLCSNNGDSSNGYEIAAKEEYLSITAPFIKTNGYYVSGDPSGYHLSMVKVGSLWGALMWQNGSTTLSTLKLKQDAIYITKSTGDEEIATKEWADSKYQTKADSENHIISSDSTVNNIVYSETEPENPTVGMIWLKKAA